MKEDGATPEDQGCLKGKHGEEYICFYKEHREVLREVYHSMKPKEVLRYLTDDDPVIITRQTANGEVSYMANTSQEVERYSWEGKLKFETAEDEMLLGLGQYEDGIYDYREKKEYLYQSNMKISMPFLISTGGYIKQLPYFENLTFWDN